MITASRDSVAYKRYEQRFMPSEKQIERPEIVKTPRNRKKRKLSPCYVVCGLVLVAAAIYMLFCQMQLTQLTAQVSEQTELLDELTAENVSLSSKKTYSMDMKEIETYATEQLGMVKMDNSQIEYVEMTNPDSVTVAKSGVSLDALFAGLVHSFSAIMEYIN